MSLVLAVLGALRAALKTRTDLTLENPRRNGLYVGEHQLVGLHAEPELPAQHLQAEAALAQRGPEGALGFELHQDPGNLFDVKLKYVQDLRGDASGGLAHHDLHHPALLVHQGSNPLPAASCSQRTREGGTLPPRAPRVCALPVRLQTTDYRFTSFCSFAVPCCIPRPRPGAGSRL